MESQWSFLLGFFVAIIENDFHVYNISEKNTFNILLICYNGICDIQITNNITHVLGKEEII